MDRKPRRRMGTLYVVATPIGNMEDMAPRAIRILREVHVIAAEDTRTVGVFLARLEIHNRQISLFEGNEARRTGELIRRLKQGQDVALVSESGTPAISDPGAVLVARAAEAGIRVVPIPGPSAAVAALSASGLETTPFLFCGFLPRKYGQRKSFLESISRIQATLIFYENPKRTAQTLQELAEVLGGRRRAVVAREISKVHEEFVRGSLEELVERCRTRKVRGEVTILVEGAPQAPPAEDWEVDQEIASLLEKGRSPGQIARKLADWTGRPKRELYRRAVELQELATESTKDSEGGGPQGTNRDDSSLE